MKKITFIGLLLLCQTSYANLQPDICVQVVNQSKDSINNNSSNLFIHNKIIYSCPINNVNINDECEVVFGKFDINDYDDVSKQTADMVYGTNKELEQLGFKFDSYNLAYGYSHSLWQVVSIAQDLKHSLSFKNNLLVINFPKDERYEIGAYPKGMFRPINYMFIQEKIKKAVIRKYQEKISRVTLSTDKNERFQYRFSYNGNRLTKAQIWFQKSPKSEWQFDSSQTYHYTGCSKL